MLTDARTWAFTLSAPWIVLDHPAYIPCRAVLPLYPRPCPETARTVQGMACVRSGQAAAPSPVADACRWLLLLLSPLLSGWQWLFTHAEGRHRQVLPNDCDVVQSPGL